MSNITPPKLICRGPVSKQNRSCVVHYLRALETGNTVAVCLSSGMTNTSPASSTLLIPTIRLEVLGPDFLILVLLFKLMRAQILPPASLATSKSPTQNVSLCISAVATAPGTLHAGLDGRALRVHIQVSPQVEHLDFQHDLVQEVIQACPLPDADLWAQSTSYSRSPPGSCAQMYGENRLCRSNQPVSCKSICQIIK